MSQSDTPSPRIFRSYTIGPEIQITLLWLHLLCSITSVTIKISGIEINIYRGNKKTFLPQRPEMIKCGLEKYLLFVYKNMIPGQKGHSISLYVYSRLRQVEKVVCIKKFLEKVNFEVIIIFLFIIIIIITTYIA